MRILMVAHSDAPWTPRYARHFVACGDDLLVATFHPDKIEGVNTEFIGVEPFDQYKNKHVFFTRVPHIRRIIKNFKPDIVYAPYLASNGLSATLAWKGPMVVAARGGDVLEQAGRTGLRKRIRQMIIQYVCKRSVMVHVVSQGLENALVELGVPKSKIFQLAVGVDSGTFYPAEEMPRPQATRLVCVRKHEPIYDIPTVIESLAILKAQGVEFFCTFGGGGSLLERHKQVASEAGLDDCVDFTGHLPHEKLPDLLRQADIYISATLSDGTSSALLEGMATGLTPVVSRIPANVPWIVHGENGLLFECGDAKGLAEMLRKAMDDIELRKRLLEFNREKINREADMKQNNDRLRQYLKQAANRNS